MSFIKTAVALSAGLLFSGLAQAHPKLLSSTPAEGAEGAAPAKIELHFSENLITKFSGAKLVMTAMPGMSAHAPMAMAARVSGSDDQKPWLSRRMPHSPPAPIKSSGARYRPTLTRSPATSRSR